jgi:hypothetical protein
MDRTDCRSRWREPARAARQGGCRLGDPADARPREDLDSTSPGHGWIEAPDIALLGAERQPITLSDLRIACSTGDGVNPAAIAAWWLGSTATPFKGSKDSGAFFGVAIPLDL